MNKFLTSQILLSTFVIGCIGIITSASAEYNNAPVRVLNTARLGGPPQTVEGQQLHLFPKKISLDHAADYQSLVAQLIDPDGVTTDVSDQVVIQIANPKIVRNEGPIFYPVADGQTTIQVTFGDLKTTIPVTTRNSKTTPDISFQNDVMPVFSKAGCNSGSCHGSSRGQDGFRLSIFGYDPKGDYYRVTREMLGRRIDLALPEECLLISKATGTVPHSGGARIKPGSPSYTTLIRWLQSGAPYDKADLPEVTGITLSPPSGVLKGSGATQRLSVRAQYSDGTDRDVTSLTYFSSNNDTSASVSSSGVVTAGSRGEAFVMCRFDKYTVGTPFIVLPKEIDFQWKPVPENNYIDAKIHAKLKKLRIQPSELCTDAEFIRRVSIDICGILPSSESVKAFINDKTPNKRAQLIDRLLDRKEFVDIWVMKWAELLQIRSTKQVSYKATLLYHNWLREQIANNVPVNEMVRELLSSRGGTFTSPATNFYQNEQNNLKVAENVAQAFLGMRIQCAQCHNHPFDRWTMEDYYGFAAFFAQVGRKKGEDPRETIIFDRHSGEVKHKVTGQVMKPKFLGGIEPDLKRQDRREVLAQWIASPENPYFAEHLANVVWAHFLGVGIVEEVDDVRVSNPPVNQALLTELGEKFKSYHYDFKKLVRDICNSRTYQRSTHTNPTNVSDSTNFSHARLRRIRAEVLLDVISQVTETKNKFVGLPKGARAVEIADGNTSNYFLTTFGRAKRETVCSCEVKMEPNLSQALHLLNGQTVHNRILQGKVIERLLAKKMPPEKIIDELYLRCLARAPTPEERKTLLAECGASKNVRQTLEDIFWAILNSQEFIFNH